MKYPYDVNLERAMASLIEDPGEEVSTDCEIDRE